MYLPPVFAEVRPDLLHDFMRRHPLALLVTQSPDGVQGDHVPLHLCQDDAGVWVLAGHVARANPLWRRHPDGAEALAVFAGPEAYVTPSWYATKAEDGRVVPTWNYMTVHARGPLRIRDDAAWLRRQVEALTDHMEHGRPRPWAVDDAPEDHVAQLLRAIVGIEIEIRGLEGKWKVSQNQPAENRAGVAEGLDAEPGAAAMAAAVRAGGPPGEA